MGHFSAGPINKAVLSFTKSLTRVHSKHFSVLKNVFALTAFELFRMVETI